MGWHGGHEVPTDHRTTICLYGRGSKLTGRGYAGFGPCFHLPGFHFGTGFLSHSHMDVSSKLWFLKMVEVPSRFPLARTPKKVDSPFSEKHRHMIAIWRALGR